MKVETRFESRRVADVRVGWLGTSHSPATF